MRHFRRLVVLVVLMAVAGMGCNPTALSPTFGPAAPTLHSPPRPTPRPPDPLVPTVPGVVIASPAPPTVAGALPASPPTGRERFGVGVPLGPLDAYPVERLGIGWYLTWWVQVNPPRPAGVDFWQMIRVSEDGYRPDEATIRAAAEANPGSTWLIGNEPDVRWQDNTTPEQYARLYHELYTLLKAVDPTCRVAIGGVAQPTPLRLAYLDRVLAAYQEFYGEPMPVDVWNVHAFILREERDSWGVDIPPGMDATAGVLYEIADHDDMELFQQQIVAFRRWMAEHGQRNRPLVVSEYGVLMPPDYGFDAARVQAFMAATFDFFLTATDDEIGYPADDNRLVQWWCWYSLADTTYPTGNLFDPQTRTPTPLGISWAGYEPP